MPAWKKAAFGFAAVVVVLIVMGQTEAASNLMGLVVGVFQNLVEFVSDFAGGL